MHRSHVNDSAVTLGSNRDRHAIMGEGELGEKGCAVFLSEPRFEKLPCVLETGRDHGGLAAEDVALAKKLRSRGRSNRKRDADHRRRERIELTPQTVGFRRMSEREADALVVFGMPGDLAKKMTFRSLYRLERRGLLDVPVLGVARQDLSDDELRNRARDAIKQTGEDLDDEVFNRFAARLSYVSGDFDGEELYSNVAKALGDRQNPHVLPGYPAVAVRDRRQRPRGGEAGSENNGSSSRSRSATTCSRRGKLAAHCTNTSTSPRST